MQLSYIELSKLVISPANMRAKHKNRDIAELIPSVRARGVLVPLLVRPNGEADVFEIVAGRRRFMAAKAACEADGEPTSVPCAIMEPGDDVAALEASLIENVARLDADEVTQWETFVKLIKDGRSVEDIAATFGIGERVVKRVLALGNLQPRIRGLYRKEEIDPATVRQLTMATPKQQREWLELYDSSDQYAPTGRMLKEWLFGGAAIRTSTALFDLAEYTAPIIADLFDDYSYFSDNALFWKLQNAAVEKKKQAYLDEGWADVVVMEPGEHFERWTFQTRPKDGGGKVYISLSPQGAMEAYEGYSPRQEAVRSEHASASSRAARPELTAPLQRYVDLHQHGLVRVGLLSRPWVALRVLLSHAALGSPLWSVRCERQRADKADTEESIANSKAQTAFDCRRSEALVQLGLDAESRTLTEALRAQTFTEVYDTLANLSDEEVMSLVPVIMGETLEAGGDPVRLLGERLDLEVADLWHADDAMLTLVRDRSILRTLIEEVAGADVADGNQDASGKVLRSILADHLHGQNGRAKVEGWVPRWLKFPPGRYLTSQADVPETTLAAVGEGEGQTETEELPA